MKVILNNLLNMLTMYYTPVHSLQGTLKKTLHLHEHQPAILIPFSAAKKEVL